MKDDLVITIKIADVAPISMRVRRDEEEKVRQVEYNINKLWTKWRILYGERSSEEVLAMVTFQFAKKYALLADQEARLDQTLLEFEKELDDILLKID